MIKLVVCEPTEARDLGYRHSLGGGLLHLELTWGVGRQELDLKFCVRRGDFF